MNQGSIWLEEALPARLGPGRPAWGASRHCAFGAELALAGSEAPQTGQESGVAHLKAKLFAPCRPRRRPPPAGEIIAQHASPSPGVREAVRKEPGNRRRDRLPDCCSRPVPALLATSRRPRGGRRCALSDLSIMRRRRGLRFGKLRAWPLRCGGAVPRIQHLAPRDLAVPRQARRGAGRRFRGDARRNQLLDEVIGRSLRGFFETSERISRDSNDAPRVTPGRSRRCAGQRRMSRPPRHSSRSGRVARLFLEQARTHMGHLSRAATCAGGLSRNPGRPGQDAAPRPRAFRRGGAAPRVGWIFVEVAERDVLERFNEFSAVEHVEPAGEPGTDSVATPSAQYLQFVHIS